MNPELLLRHKLVNWVQSTLMLGGMGLLAAALGYLIGGVWLMLLTAGVGVLLLAFGPRVSPRLLLAMYDARRMDPYTAPEIYALTEELARRAELRRTPTLYYVPSRMLNAFTVGRPDEAVIAVTDGLLRHLNLRELAGVLAHEISHVRNNDMWVMGVADLVSRMTSFFSLVGQVLLLVNLPLIVFTEATIPWLALVLLIFAPTIAALLQLALSRTREYDADLDAARLTGDPAGLASALAQLEQSQGGWLERIFMPGRRDPNPSLLRTHPPMDNRIRRLLALVRGHARLPRSLPAVTTQPYRPSEIFPPVTRHPRWRVYGIWR
jgi:heat shock protein HtpX